MSLVNLNLLLLVLLSLSASWEARSMADASVIRVDMFNELPDGAILTVHCKMKAEDLGTHTVGPNQRYWFPIGANLSGTTLFSCGASWQGGHADFDIFKPERDVERCRGYCRWEARRDAVVGLRYNSWEPDIVIPWK